MAAWLRLQVDGLDDDHEDQPVAPQDSQDDLEPAAATDTAADVQAPPSMESKAAVPVLVSSPAKHASEDDSTSNCSLPEVGDLAPGGKQRAKHGTMGTFAGRYPPKDAAKLKHFEMLQQAYTRMDLAAMGGKRMALGKNPQKDFWKYMTAEIVPGDEPPSADHLDGMCQKWCALNAGPGPGSDDEGPRRKVARH